MLLKGELRESILNSTRSDYVLRRVVGRERVLYYIRLVVNLDLDKWKSLHLGITPWT